MDLRGVTPEDVYQLMGSGLNLMQLQGSEAMGNAKLRSSEAQNSIENMYRALKIQQDAAAEARLQRGQDADLSRPRDIGTYTANGKVYIRSVDPVTNQIVTKEVGDAPVSNKDNTPKLYVDGTGKPFWAKPGDPIPQGSKGFFNQDGGLSVNDQFALTSMKNDLLSGGDTSGMDMSDEVNADNAMTMVNQYDPNDQFVKIPGQPKSTLGVSYTGSPQYIKLPKRVQGFDALPDSKVVGWSDKEGKEITMRQVRETAARANTSVAEVLKYLELIK